MAFVEPEYKGLKEKRKKERGDSKKKKISFLVPPNPTLILIPELFHILHTDTQVTFFMDSPSGN